MPLTNATVKLVTSLADVKGRRRAALFVAEGSKCVLDTLPHFRLEALFATRDWAQAHPEAADRAEIVTRADLLRLTTLSLAPDVIAVYHLPEPQTFEPTIADHKLVVALDRVQDPGNLGTIIRTADWMGIDTILASTDTVDAFNPKTIQATMGAISRVSVIYGDLPAMLAKASSTDIYGTFLDGENIYNAPLTPCGIVVMGNEGRGISEVVASHVTRRLLIPSYPPQRPTSESLNVATATAIVLSQFRSRLF